MRVLALLHEAFGGEGGIAQFNRDFVTAAAGSPAVEEVALLLRRLPAPPGPVPDRVLLHRAGAGGKILYGVAALKAATFGGRIDIVLCGHLRLLRLGRLAPPPPGRPPVLICVGIDGLQPPRPGPG